MITLSIKNMTSIAKKLKMNISEGKHTNARFKVNGVVVVTTCWSHGRNEIPKGTASKILKHQLHIDTKEQAFALRDCHMKLPDYIAHLIHKRIIANEQ